MSGAVHQKVATHLAKIQIAGDQIQTVGEIVLIREILKHQDKGKINYPGVAGRGRSSLHRRRTEDFLRVRSRTVRLKDRSGRLTKADQVRPASPGSIHKVPSRI